MFDTVKTWVGGPKSGVVNTSRAAYRMMVLLGRYCQNTVFITNSVLSTANNGVEGELVRRRWHTPALGESLRVSDM